MIDNLILKQMKILNLYAGIGGNRKLWGNYHEITAVEIDEKIADIYKKKYPNDTVIVADAHQYLLNHYKEFDFIWSSPPCPTHSRARYWNSSNYDTTTKGVYPDMMLYQEILFLQHYFKGKYVVENVIPFYEPLIQAKKRGRHLYWTNFNLPNDLRDRRFAISQVKNELKELQSFHKINVLNYIGEQSKVKVCRNLVDYEAGKTILETVIGITRKENINQTELF